MASARLFKHQPTFNTRARAIPIAHAQPTPQYHDTPTFEHDGRRECMRCVHAVRVGALRIHLQARKEAQV